MCERVDFGAGQPSSLGAGTGKTRPRLGTGLQLLAELVPAKLKGAGGLLWAGRWSLSVHWSSRPCTTTTWDAARPPGQLSYIEGAEKSS